MFVKIIKTVPCVVPLIASKTTTSTGNCDVGIPLIVDVFCGGFRIFIFATTSLSRIAISFCIDEISSLKVVLGILQA